MIEIKYMASSVVSVNPVDLQQLSKAKFDFRNIILFYGKYS
jgi:hypothetical protein